MDATGVVLRQPLRYSYSSYPAAVAAQSSWKEFRISSASICVRSMRRASKILSSGFCDQGHVKYYNSNFGPSSSSKAAAGMTMSAISGKKEKTVKDKKMKKKQLKLLKGLSKDLSTFSQMGFGLDSDGALLDQVKGNMISEAAELMLKQLQKLKAEEKELKRKMKEEKARLKAARLQNSVIDCEMSSSSSSSESSSDSRCGEIVDMNNLKSKQTILQQVIEEATTSTAYPIPVIPVITSLESNVLLERSYNAENKRDCHKTNNLCEADLSSSLVMPTCSKKIEVCMGGKCKKSGAGALLEKFQCVVGTEGAVSGCKCMGKCRDGPNVKVLNGFDGVFAEKSVKEASANSLCIGVGLEDVDMIVANFLGDNHNQVSFAAAC